MSITVDPPTRLPVSHISLSSLSQFMKCPEAWRRRYIDHDPEPASGKMVLGGAAGAALTQHYGHQIETGQGLSTEQLLDEFSSEWDERTGREEVDFEADTPGQLKDSACEALAIYHRHIAPDISPVSVEREFTLRWPGCEWALTGFIDLEEESGALADYKMRARRLTEKDAAADLQPTVYCAARRVEGNAASVFRFHTMVRTKQPTAEIVETTRSEQSLDRLSDRIFALAREIEWRCETDTWAGAAPNTWFCSACRHVDCPLRLGS